MGQIVRSKKYGGLLRVMEKREIWQDIEDDPQTRMVPSIYLAYWKVQKGVLPVIGKMFAYAYTLHENTFEANWEIVEGDE